MQKIVLNTLDFPVCPLDNLIVKLDKRFQDQIVTPGGLRLFIAHEFNPGEYATITGTVVSLPRAMSDHNEFKHIVPEARVGDELFFSYLVVWSMDERFSYPVYENEFDFKGESYWKVPYHLVHGYIRNGEITPASGHIFLDPADKERHPEKIGSLWIPDNAREKKEVIVRAKVKHIGKPYSNMLKLNVQPGDTVIFEKKFVENYKLNGRLWWVLKQERVLAKQLGSKIDANIYKQNGSTNHT